MKPLIHKWLFVWSKCHASNSFSLVMAWHTNITALFCPVWQWVLSFVYHCVPTTHLTPLAFCPDWDLGTISVRSMWQGSLKTMFYIPVYTCFMGFNEWLTWLLKKCGMSEPTIPSHMSVILLLYNIATTNQPYFKTCFSYNLFCLYIHCPPTPAPTSTKKKKTLEWMDLSHQTIQCNVNWSLAVKSQDFLGYPFLECGVVQSKIKKFDWA